MSAENDLRDELNSKGAVPKTNLQARRSLLIPAGICFILLGLALIFGAKYFFSHPYWGNTRGEDKDIRPIPATAFGRKEILRTSNFKKNKSGKARTNFTQISDSTVSAGVKPAQAFETADAEKTGRGFAKDSAVHLLAFNFASDKSDSAKPASSPTPKANKSSADKEKRNFFEKIYDWFAGLFKKKKKPKNCSCPTLAVSGSESPVRFGEPMTFTANVSGGSQNTIGYNWSVSQGEILGGQGTPTIEVSTRGLVTTNVEATVKLSGVECADCTTSASASGTIAFTANPGGGIIEGKVTSPEGFPLEEVNITVINTTTGASVAAAVTDFDGNYRVSGLKPGIYTVIAKLWGVDEEGISTQVRLVAGFSSTVNFIFKLPGSGYIPPETPSPTPSPIPLPTPPPNLLLPATPERTPLPNANVKADTDTSVKTDTGNANTSINTNADDSNTSANTNNGSANVSANTNSGQKPTKDKVEYSYPKRLVKDTTHKVILNLQPAKPDDVTTANTAFNNQANGIVVLNVPVPQEAGYTTHVAATLLADDGLEILSPNRIQQEYTRSSAPGNLTEWSWDVKLTESGEKKETIQISFKLDVELKKAGGNSKIINDFWSSEKFNIGVGLLLFQALGGLFLGGGGLATAAGTIKGKKFGKIIEKIADEVHCTLYAPVEARAGSDFLVQVFAHLPTQAAGLGAIAEASDEAAKQQAARALDKLIERGSVLTFELRISDFDVDEPVQSHQWNGMIVEVPFVVSIPRDYQPGGKIGKIIVSENGVPIGRLTFKIEIVNVVSLQSSAAKNVPVNELERYRRAFISYSSKDRPKVLPRVQMLEAAGIECFQDLLSIRPGENWAEKLYEFIDKSDAFYLFWSAAARDSAEVEKEILYATERLRKTEGDSPDIIPIIIEGPPPVAPPEKLNFLHFNDKHIYFSHAVEAENEAKKSAGKI